MVEKPDRGKADPPKTQPPPGNPGDAERALTRRIEDLVEDKVREAQQRGDFENLPGKGRPLHLSDNPLVPSHVQMAHRLLANAGFAPDWVELAKEIDAYTARCRTLIERGREQEARELLAEVVKKTRLFNLKVPLFTMQRAIPRWQDLTEEAPGPKG